MAQTVCTLELADELVRIVTDGLKTTLGLKVVAVGDLNQLPSPESLDTWLPAVLVKPLDHKKEPGPVQTYQVTNRFKVFYLRRWTDGEDVLREEIEDLLTIEQELEEHYDLPQADLPDNITHSLTQITRGDYDDEANAFFAAQDIPISALSLEVEVETEARR